MIYKVKPALRREQKLRLYKTQVASDTAVFTS